MYFYIDIHLNIRSGPPCRFADFFGGWIYCCIIFFGKGKVLRRDFFNVFFGQDIVGNLLDFQS